VELASVDVTRSDGTALHIAPMIALVQPPSGKPMRALLVLRDITSIRRYQDSLRALNDRLLANEEEQRLRISRYMHDMIIQNLSLSRIQLGTVEHSLASHSLSGEAETVHHLRSLVDETIDQCRSVMSDLAPPLLHEVGLVPALNELADKLRSHSEADIRIIDEGLTDAIEDHLLSLLFQITRELIMNALKHAGECNVDVRVRGGDGTVRIQVQDNGRGFDVPAAESHFEHRASFGLFSIRERIGGLGGRLVIQSRPGEGTTATVTIPLTESGEPDPAPEADSR
ncbi:MAG: ATP-binding protein, partial [bacterium]